MPQVSALDDPNLGLTYYGEQAQTRVGEVQAGFMASQKIPFYGKLRLSGEVAENEANAIGERYSTHLLRLLVSKLKEISNE